MVVGLNPEYCIEYKGKKNGANQKQYFRRWLSGTRKVSKYSKTWVITGHCSGIKNGCSKPKQ